MLYQSRPLLKLQEFDAKLFRFFEHDRPFKVRQYGFCIWLPSCLTNSEITLFQEVYNYCYHPEPDCESSSYSPIFNYWDIFCLLVKPVTVTGDFHAHCGNQTKNIPAMNMVRMIISVYNKNSG